MTVVALAWLVHEALAAADELAKEGISVEVVDPRTLVPLDHETIRASVRKTGRLRHRRRGGADGRLLGRDCRARRPRIRRRLPRLKAPVKRVCALDVPIPYSPVLEDHVFPDRKRIIAGIRQVLGGPK